MKKKRKGQRLEKKKRKQKLKANIRSCMKRSKEGRKDSTDTVRKRERQKTKKKRKEMKERKQYISIQSPGTVNREGQREKETPTEHLCTMQHVKLNEGDYE